MAWPLPATSDVSHSFHRATHRATHYLTEVNQQFLKTVRHMCDTCATHAAVHRRADVYQYPPFRGGICDTDHTAALAL